MKYLFGCEHGNQTYHQTKDDVSKKNSKKSAFYDVMNKKIKKFWIEGNGHKYLVDLTDGHFEVDGNKFKIKNSDIDDLTDLDEFRIIYYRRHTLGYTGVKEVTHDIDYCIGWQANDKNGKNHKQILTVE